MIGPITERHYEQILQMNQKFVDWLSPLDMAELKDLLGLAQYAQQIQDGQGVLIGYAHDVNYPDHKNLTWLRQRLTNFFYIDRIIIAESAQGQQLGQKLYDDIERVARERGHDWLVCEVNTVPDNPGSHRFHEKREFQSLGEESYPAFQKAVRYYAKAL